jgi:15-cis-phytoene synthase
VARATLDWWRGEVEALFHGRPNHPVTLALLPFIAGTFGITQVRLAAIIDGMDMDLQQNRYLDFAALRGYAHLVAGVVGEMSASIFGYRHVATLEYADRLGIALQLINVIRDVGEDARRGRVYLPLDELQQFGVKVADVLQGRTVGGFVPMMQFQAERARALYREALALLPVEDRKAQRTGLIMGAIYSTLLDEIERDGFRVLHQRIALTPLRKLWIAWKTWVST